VDFLKTTTPKDNIILNPPLKKKNEFVRHALDLAKYKVAVLLPTIFETRVGVQDILENTRLPWKAHYIFTQSVAWLNTGQLGGFYTFAWFVFERDYEGEVKRERITLPKKKHHRTRQGNGSPGPAIETPNRRLRTVAKKNQKEVAKKRKPQRNTARAKRSDLYARAEHKFERAGYLVRQAVDPDYDEVSGVLIYGPGRCGKSFTVQNELERLGRKHELINSQLTGRGCWDKLEANVHGIFVIEEVEKVLRSDTSEIVGVIRSAGYGQKGKDGRRRRIVTWGTAQGLPSFEFHGAIIIISNLPINNGSSLHALASRFSIYEMSLTNDEIIACAYTWAKNGHKNRKARMTAAECRKVLDVMAKEFEDYDVKFDLRLIEQCYADYLYWRDDEENRLMAWESRVVFRVEERAEMLNNAADTNYVGGKREEKLRVQEEVFRNIIDQTDNRSEQVARFIQAGYSRAAFYRTAKRLGFDFHPE